MQQAIIAAKFLRGRCSYWQMAARLMAPGAAFIVCTMSATATELPLQRVILSTSGLAQFTYSGTAAAGDKLDLSVRLDQVDDILKSLTVFDREGAIGAVTLPGKAPLQEMFRDLSFGPEALNSPANLLNALVGSEIEIEGQVNARGRVFRVEEEPTSLPNNGGEVTRHRLTLLTDKGLVQAVLEELSALRFVDPQTNARVASALSGLAENHAKDRRAITIGLLGQGSRQVGFSYVVAAPVWKTSYRLVLPKDGDAARLQGWAVVENLTGSDRKDVDLSLVSGNPVALKQPLYTAFYVDRPEIPVTSSVRLVPQKDEADTAVRFGGMVPQPQFDLPAPSAARGASLLAVAPVAKRDEALGYAANPAQSEEASTQVLFRFPTKVSLAAGSTMMVPFVDRNVTAGRTWLYQPGTNAHHPLAAVRLRNDGDSALPPGLITAFDGASDGGANFAGDAQLPLTPKDATKFITFALDGKTDIRRESHGGKQTKLGTVVNGVLTVTERTLLNFDYEITPPPNEDRDIVIEEARGLNAWKPVAEATDVEETPTRIRYKVSAPRGQTTKATLALERIERQTIILSTLAPEQVLATITGLDDASPALKDTVTKLGALVADLNSATAQRAELADEAKQIADDQARIRENLAAVGQSSDLGRRYIDTLRKQEDRLAAIATADKALESDAATKRKAAEELAKNLSS